MYNIDWYFFRNLTRTVYLFNYMLDRVLLSLSEVHITTSLSAIFFLSVSYLYTCLFLPPPLTFSFTCLRKSKNAKSNFHEN